MELEQQNRLNMIAGCLMVLDSEDHEATWLNQEPEAFTDEVAALRALQQAALATEQKIRTPITGTAAVKKDAETALEDRCIALMHPLAYHFTKTNDPENLAKVNYTEDAIRKLRHQELSSTAKIIRDCGTHARTHADATRNGISQAKVTALSEAITAFDAVIAAPRAKITDRTVFVRELVTQLAACVAQLELMDRLIAAFADKPNGPHLIAAWKQARMIVDAGGGQGGEEEEPPAGENPPTP